MGGTSADFSLAPALSPDVHTGGLGPCSPSGGRAQPSTAELLAGS